MSGQHTPGPWIPADAADNRVVIYGGDRCICLVGDQGDPVVDADARLMAAAPELLAALEAFTDTTNAQCPVDHPAFALARAAIAKARGQA
jgi:hypothetical protein